MDTKQKYVKLKEYNQIIIFNSLLSHNQFENFGIASAGFCYVGEDKVTCFGESVTLKLKSDENDSYYATKQLFGYDNAISLKIDK